jgi:hypothetical protein
VLNWYGDAIEKLEPYAKAYHSAALLLLQSSTEAQLRDVGACPVVFLYRMALELYFKSILISGSKILRLDGSPSKTAEQVLKLGHDLEWLLDEFRDLCKELDWEWDAQYESVAELVTEFHKNDPGSFCFRYPITKKGDSALERDFRFSLRTFCLRMDEMLECLDQIDCNLAGILDEAQQAY